MEDVALKNAPSTYKSWVWQHFGFRKDDKSVATCKICLQDVNVRTGSTTNLATHLQRRHEIRGSKPSTSESNVTSNSGADDKRKADTSGKSTQKVKTATASGKLRLTDVFKGNFGKHHPRAQAITKAIGYFIASDMRPYSVVQKEGFKHLVSTLEPRYTLPSRTFFSETVIPDMYKKVKARVVSDLEKATAISITTDSWTSRATESYVAVTAHFIDPDWEFKSYTLQTRQLSESHTGAHLADVLNGTITEWNLQRRGKGPAITTDNASNIINGVKEANLFPHVTCFAHTLNLATQRGLKVPQMERLLAKVRKIVSFFHKSTTASAMLKSKQTMLQIPTHKLIIDVQTRWNSTYDMVSRYLEQQPAIFATLMMKEIKKNSDLLTLSDEEIKSAEAVVCLLEPIKTVTTLMCDEGNPTVSLIHPLKERLIQHLALRDTDTTLVKETKKAISKDLVKRYVLSHNIITN
jgi:hypothetical protein